MQKRWREAKQEQTEGQECDEFSHEPVWLEEEEGTHEVSKGTSPPTLLPGKLVNTFELNQESALEVEKFIEIGEEQVNGVEVDCIALGKRIGIGLSGTG